MYGWLGERARYAERCLAIFLRKAVYWSRSVPRAPDGGCNLQKAPLVHAVAPAWCAGPAGVVAVVAALRHLPDRQREAIVLRYYADLSEAEIATAMGISRGAVKSHTARGMSALRAALEQE